MVQKLETCDRLSELCSKVSGVYRARFLLFQDGLFVQSLRDEDHQKMLDNLQDKRLEDILLAGSITNRTVERGNDDPILVEASGSSSLGGFRKLVKSGDPNLVVTLLKNLPDAGGYNIMPSRS